MVGVEPADGDVVEEEQRLGALAHDVVDAHGDEVDADGVEAAGGLGDERLGADAVGRRHQHRVAVAVAGEGEQPAEAADVADDLGPERRADVVLDALDRLLAGRDVDAGAAGRSRPTLDALGQPARARARSSSPGGRAVGSSSTALRRPDRDLDRVVAGEAGVAEPGAGRAGGADEPVEGEVGQAVGADVVADLVDGELGGEQLAAVADVDAVEARPLAPAGA